MAVNLSATTQSVISTAILGGLLGATYGALVGPKGYKEQDAGHYGLLIAAVGAVAGALLVPPTVTSG